MDLVQRNYRHWLGAMLSSLAQSLAPVACGIFAGLLAAEIALRLAGYSYAGFLYKPDPLLGWTLQPNVAGWHRNGESVWLFVKTNSRGLMDVEHQLKKPANTFRVAVLGDSFTEPQGVAFRKSFWWVMQQALHDCAALRGRLPEAVNFGVDSYGPPQELLMLQTRVWRYSPDAVVVAFYPGNDITDTMPEWKKNGPRPYFRVERGALVLDDSAIRRSSILARRKLWSYRLYVFLSERSRVLQLIDYTRDEFHGGALRRFLRERFGKANSMTSRSSSFVLNPSTTTTLLAEGPAWQRAWETTGMIFTSMRREALRHHALFLVVALSEPPQVYPDPHERALYQERWGIPDVFSTNRRLDAIGRENGFQVLDLGPQLQRYADSHHVFLHGFPGIDLGNGHWNETAHRLAGNSIADKLCTMIGDAKD